MTGKTPVPPNDTVRERKLTELPLWTTLLLISATAAAPMVAGQSSTAAVDTAPLIGSAEERAGELDALARRWWQEVNEDPASLDSQWKLVMWNRLLGPAARTTGTADEWRRLHERLGDNGWTQRVVGWILRARLRSEGDFAGARAVGMARGSLRRWIGIGPFGHSPAVALHRSYEPEMQFDAEAEYDGAFQPVRWRTLSIPGEDTRLYPLDQWSRRGAVFYLRSRFSVADGGPAILQIASPGSFKLFLDGREVAQVDRTRTLRPAVLRIGVQLAPGPHTVLVKSDGGSVSLLVRDPGGFPFALEQLDPWVSDTAGAASRQANAGSRRDPAVIPTELSPVVWQGMADRGELDTDRRLALAVYLGVEGEAARLRRVLIDVEGRDDIDPVAIAMAASRCAPFLGYLPGDWKKNWLKRWRTRALTQEPHVIPLRIDEARDHFRDDRIAEALAAISSIIEDQPGSLPALFLKEQILGRRGWDREHDACLERIAELAPDDPSALGRRIRRWMRQDRDDAALPLRETLYRVDPSTANATSLVQAYAACGRRDDALALLGKIRERGGDSVQTLRTVDSLLHDLGLDEERLELNRELTARIPDDSALHVAAADVLWELDRRDDAAAAMRRALELNPGRIEWLRRLEHLESGRADAEVGEGDEFWRPYARDGSAAIAAAPPRDAYPDAGAVYLIDQMVSRIGPSGGREEMIHQVMRIDSAQAVEEFSDLDVPGEILELRVITPDGEELHPTAGGGRGSYTLPGLTSGTFIEYRCILREDLARPEDVSAGPFYFRDPDMRNAFHLTEFVVLVPRDWPVIVRERFIERTSDREVGDMRELIWLAEKMDRREPEPLSPPQDEILPNVAVYAQQDWADALELVASRGAFADYVTPEIEDVAGQILEGVEGRRAKIEALYDAACDRVRRNGGFGTNAAEIWIQRSGDRNLLLAALLRAADIPFEWVFSAPKDSLNPFADWTLPSARHFQIPFLRVALEESGRALYLNALYRLAAPGRVPRAVSGARALRITPEGTRWIRMPSEPIEESAQELDLQITLAEPGAPVRVSGSWLFRNLESARDREQLANVTEKIRDDQLGAIIGGLFRGAEFHSRRFVELERRGAPLRLEFEIEAPQLVQRSETGPVLQPILMPAQLRRSFVGRGERTLPLWSRAEVMVVNRVRIHLGEHHVVRRLPESLDVTGPWGSYHISYNSVPGGVTMERRFELIPFQLQPEEYAELISICTRIDRKEEERVLFSTVEASR